MPFKALLSTQNLISQRSTTQEKVHANAFLVKHHSEGNVYLPLPQSDTFNRHHREHVAVQANRLKGIDWLDRMQDNSRGSVPCSLSTEACPPLHPKISHTESTYRCRRIARTRPASSKRVDFIKEYDGRSGISRSPEHCLDLLLRITHVLPEELWTLHGEEIELRCCC